MKRLLVLALLAACGPAASTETKQTLPPPPPPTPTDTKPVAQNPADEALPLWSEVKTGKLANGLTYFILPHHKPEKRVFMWLAVNAGSNLEDDDQKGLAHFDEHMAFNGTKRFPKAEDVVNYLQSIGMRFGADLNAYTSWDQTVYQLEVPTDKPEFVAKGFDILRDWAGDVSYDPKEVDKERGVVESELRNGLGAGKRIFDKQSKVLFHGSRYADRITIGDFNTLDKAPRDALYRFYKDWYRPDLMAVIVVGDINPSDIEAQIKKEFADLKNPDKERPRIHAEVPKADGTHVSIETDHEMPGTVVSVYNIVPHRTRASATDDRRLVVEQVYAQVLNERFDELRRKSDAPFLQAGAGASGLVREIDAFTRTAFAKQGHVEDALRSLFTETLRVERHGFTQSELDRARTNVARQYEEEEASAETASSRSYAEELVRHFLEHEFVIGRAAEKKLADQYLPTITVDDLNKLASSYGGAENRVILIAGPDGKPLPTQQKVLEIIDEVNKSTIPAWEDKAPTVALIDKTPTPGKITSETKLDKIGAVDWKLSNGVRVIVKPTDYEADNVVIEARSPGGEATVGDKDWLNARWGNELVEVSGLGQLDAASLQKALAGKQVRVNAEIGDVDEGLNARGSAKDVETMLQLMYLYMTEPRKDDEAIKAWKIAVAEQLRNAANNPEFQFQKRVEDALYNGNVRHKIPEPEELDKIDADKAIAFYKDRFGDASDFTFVIVGQVDLDKLKPMVETYLGGLPAKKRIEKEKDLKILKVGGVVKKEWKIGQAEKAQVRLDFHGDESWTRDKDRDMYILGNVLANKLRENLREDKGGVYGVRASGSMERSPHPQRSFIVQFTCDPKRVEELVTAVNDEIAKMIKDGASQDYFDKAKETFLRQRETELRTNGFWAGWLSNAFKYGDDPALVLDTTGMTNRMTNDNLKAAAKKYLDSKQLFRAVLLPEK